MTTYRTTRRRSPLLPHDHTEWCAGGHQCGLGEHRSDMFVIESPNRGRVTITRVRATTGREHAEVRITVALSTDQTTAGQQLLTVWTDVETLLAHLEHPHTRRAA